MKKNNINWWNNYINKKSKKILSNFILKNQSFGEGKYTKIFEKKVCRMVGSKYGLSTTSGTSALTLSLYTLGVRPGDEILIPNRGWIATAHSAYILGAKPILVETTKDQKININEITKKITKKTKVIIPVHVNGSACEIHKIIKIAKKYKIKIIEDSCQAFLSKLKNKYLGTFGDLGCYSFGTTKLLNNIQGGFVVTNNQKLYKNLKLVKNHGVFNNFTDQWNQPGFNFKYNDIQSNLGLSNLKFVNKKIQRLKLIYKIYKEKINNKNISFLNNVIEKGEVPLYVLVHSKKKGFIKYMKKNDITIRPLPPSISESKYIISKKKYNFEKYDKYFKNCYYLPSGPDIKFLDLNKVCKVINKFGQI